MTAAEIVAELRSLGSETTKKTLMKHGAREPFFGVKIGDMKPIQKRIKSDYKLALELYDTGISDAMYLAGLIADDARMTKANLQKWVKAAYWYMLSEYTVPWVASGNCHGRDLAVEWIESKKEGIASAGWSTLSSLAATKPDDALDLDAYRSLLVRVLTTIHDQPNRVRYTMNGFVIAVGSYIKPLTPAALQAAAAIGPVGVDMGGTSCRVPPAVETIRKVEANGTLGKKRKSAKC